jgi:hypothetical protein
MRRRFQKGAEILRIERVFRLGGFAFGRRRRAAEGAHFLERRSLFVGRGFGLAPRVAEAVPSSGFSEADSTAND